MLSKLEIDKEIRSYDLLEAVFKLKKEKNMNKDARIITKEYYNIKGEGLKETFLQKTKQSLNRRRYNVMNTALFEKLSKDYCGEILRREFSHGIIYQQRKNDRVNMNE